MPEEAGFASSPMVGSATSQRYLRPLLGMLLFSAGIVAYSAGLHSFLDWDYLRAHVDEWRRLAREHLFLASLLFCAVCTSLTALSIPAVAALALLAGALFDRWLGVALASVSCTTGGVLAFVAARFLFQGWLRRHFGDRLRGINDKVRRDGAFYLFSLRMTPLVPSSVVNFGMAVAPMRLSTFILASWLGTLLPICLYVNAGMQLANIRRPSEALSVDVVLSLIVLALAPLFFRWILSRLPFEGR